MKIVYLIITFLIVTTGIAAFYSFLAYINNEEPFVAFFKYAFKHTIGYTTVLLLAVVAIDNFIVRRIKKHKQVALIALILLLNYAFFFILGLLYGEAAFGFLNYIKSFIREVLLESFFFVSPLLVLLVYFRTQRKFRKRHNDTDVAI